MVDITKTRTDLIEWAATELGALTSNQTLSEEDSATIDDVIDPLLRQLSLDSVITIGDTDAIESEFFMPLAGLLANACAKSFGQQYSADVKREYEHQLRRLSSTKPTYETLATDYF